MQISGHKTRSIFDRYNIVSDSDLQSAARMQAAYLERIGEKASETSTLTSTLAYFPTKEQKREEAVNLCAASK